jgi:hypothetical protein
MTFEGVFKEKWHANTVYLMLITGINMIVEGVPGGFLELRLFLYQQ